jgi:hypothetical protein
VEEDKLRPILVDGFSLIACFSVEVAAYGRALGRLVVRLVVRSRAWSPGRLVAWSSGRAPGRPVARLVVRSRAWSSDHALSRPVAWSLGRPVATGPLVAGS